MGFTSLTAGEGITISNNVISASGGGDTTPWNYYLFEGGEGGGGTTVTIDGKTVTILPGTIVQGTFKNDITGTIDLSWIRRVVIRGDISATFVNATSDLQCVSIDLEFSPTFEFSLDYNYFSGQFYSVRSLRIRGGIITYCSLEEFGSEDYPCNVEIKSDLSQTTYFCVSSCFISKFDISGSTFSNLSYWNTSTNYINSFDMTGVTFNDSSLEVFVQGLAYGYNTSYELIGEIHWLSGDVDIQGWNFSRNSVLNIISSFSSDGDLFLSDFSYSRFSQAELSGFAECGITIYN